MNPDKMLDGIRIVDWTIYQAGPCAAAYLADLGAEVIHVEEREHGDLLRGNMRLGGRLIARPQDRGLNFEEHNRNKKSLSLDIAKPEAHEIMHRLVAKSDVFLTNFRLPVVKKHGMTYKDLKAYNPRLIHASITAYGRKGPIADNAGIDTMAQARSGITMASGQLNSPPQLVTNGVGDRIASMYIVYGILGALFARERGGGGMEVTTSQLGSMIGIQGYAIMPTLFQDLDPEYPRKDRNSTNPLQNMYRCSDGRWMQLWIIAPYLEQKGETQWPKFCMALQRPGLIDDPRYANYEKRMDNCRELIETLQAVFAQRPQREWQEVFEATGLMVSVVNTLQDLRDDPQVLANDYIRNWDHPALGPIRIVANPLEFNGVSPSFRLAAPELGEHSEEILTEVCGYSWDDVIRLKDSAVV